MINRLMWQTMPKKVRIISFDISDRSKFELRRRAIDGTNYVVNFLCYRRHAQKRKKFIYDLKVGFRYYQRLNFNVWIFGRIHLRGVKINDKTFCNSLTAPISLLSTLRKFLYNAGQINEQKRLKKKWNKMIFRYNNMNS